MKRQLMGLMLFAVAVRALALEIDPQVLPEINFGGRGLGTLSGAWQRGDGTAAAAERSSVDFADSSLLFGFSKYLFNGPPRYGFANFGLRRPESATAIGSEVYLHELNVGIGTRDYEFKIGRTRLRNNLLMFPTIRDDDLLTFTHVANAAAAVDTDVYEIFGGVADAQWFPRRGIVANASLTARTATDAFGNVTQDGKINGANLGVAYALPESIKFDRGIRFAGMSWDGQKVAGANDARLHAYLAALVYNLNSDPEADWVWESQVIANQGIDQGAPSVLNTKMDRARAKSRSIVTALRFNRRPYLQTRWQAALTLAAKDYCAFDNARTYAMAPSFLYRLGSGVDWVTQYIYTANRGTLAQQTGIEREHRLYTGVSFAFDYTLNESVAERNSILTLEHNMASSYGPVRGAE